MQSLPEIKAKNKSAVERAKCAASPGCQKLAGHLGWHVKDTAPQDEPIFVLRAQDESAPLFVEMWAQHHAQRMGYQHPKIVSALEICRKMRAWPTRKSPD